MQFKGFKRFQNLIADTKSLAGYLFGDLTNNWRDLEIGLTRLTFTENFEAFEATATIGAGATVAIRNQLRGGVIPTKRIIVRATGSTIDDGATEWTKDYVYLRNTGGSSVTVTAIFLR